VKAQDLAALLDLALVLAFLVGQAVAQGEDEGVCRFDGAREGADGGILGGFGAGLLVVS
jgi:hypothetical protein